MMGRGKKKKKPHKNPLASPQILLVILNIRILPSLHFFFLPSP